MAPPYPEDRFDRIPEGLTRVGAHRTARRRASGWVWFGWAALATGVLVALGIGGLFLINDRVSFEFSGGGIVASEAPAPEPATPTVDPAAAVQVLNGTTTAGLAADVADQLAADGWEGDITAANASSDDITETVVYYEDPAQESAALGLVESLGQGRVELSDAFAIPAQEGEAAVNRLTVVLGADYTVP